MVDAVVGHGVDGATVLEIGGGVGEVQLELLRRGAARATSLELSASYDADAAALAAELGVAGRVRRLRLDLAAAPEAVERHDVVVLHRVVCCYPEPHRLLAAAAGRATRLLVYSHPPRNVLSRAAAAGENAAFRLRRSAFRVYAHDPAAIAESVERAGLSCTYRHDGLAWHVLGFTAGP
ncbi:MAG TPA: methyltransferase domain-containing protein [Dermatophilaceae bacterium]|nr:methyltransferase domain-containing protein [Dermatophilaceae bacterium]